MCGSDLYLFNGEVEALVAPGHTTLGHEISGVVVETGAEVARFKSGDRVTFPYSVSCGRCECCVAGQTAHCLTSGKAIYGFGTAFGDLGGSQAEYVRVPLADAHLMVLPESVSDDVAPFLSCNLPAAITVVDAAEIGPNDSVALIGCGPTGLLAAELVSKRTGGPVFVIDPVAFRRDHAAGFGGTAVDPNDATAVERILSATNGLGVHKVIEVAGRGAALDLAVAVTRPGGTISGGGVYLEQDHPVSLFDIFLKNLRLVANGFANAKMAQDKALAALAQGTVDPAALITHRVGLDELPQTAIRFADRERGFLKMLITT